MVSSMDSSLATEEVTLGLASTMTLPPIRSMAVWKLMRVRVEGWKNMRASMRSSKRSILLRLNSSSSLPSSKRFSSCSLDMSLIEMKFLPTWSTASMRPFMERMYLDMGDS